MRTPQGKISVYNLANLRTQENMKTNQTLSLQILNERSSLLKSTQCPQELENKIGCGQLEECIIQAKYELDLAKRMLEERAWESLISEPPKNQWKWPL